LNEAELAESFGMGRGPLREALRHLEGMQLVKRIPNVGARLCWTAKHSPTSTQCAKHWKAWPAALPQCK
jgi:DNA-binding FadR family transcriptional regulator